MREYSQRRDESERKRKKLVRFKAVLGTATSLSIPAGMSLNHITMQYRDLTSKDKAILFAQAKACKICHGKSGTRRLVTDHCHVTGIVRGVLCEKCNSWLGVTEGTRTLAYKKSHLRKIQRKYGIAPEDFLFYLDTFRQAYIKSLFQYPAVPKKPNTDVYISVEIE